jgi:hypothetical protein
MCVSLKQLSSSKKLVTDRLATAAHSNRRRFCRLAAAFGNLMSFCFSFLFSLFYTTEDSLLWRRSRAVHAISCQITVIPLVPSPPPLLFLLFSSPTCIKGARSGTLRLIEAHVCLRFSYPLLLFLSYAFYLLRLFF